MFYWQKMLDYRQRFGCLRSDLRLGQPTTADGFIPACYRYAVGNIAYYLSHVVITRKRRTYTPEKNRIAPGHFGVISLSVWGNQKLGSPTFLTIKPQFHSF